MQIFVASSYINLAGRIVHPGETLSDREMEGARDRLVECQAVEKIADLGGPAPEPKEVA